MIAVSQPPADPNKVDLRFLIIIIISLLTKKLRSIQRHHHCWFSKMSEFEKIETENSAEDEKVADEEISFAMQALMKDGGS